MKEIVKNIVLVVLVIWSGFLNILLLSTCSGLELADIRISHKQDEVEELQRQVDELHQMLIVAQNSIDSLNTEIAIRDDRIVAVEEELTAVCDATKYRESCADLTSAEIDALRRIAMAEAGNQGVIGKALVMLTVLNRVECPNKYGSSIEGVVLSGAYTVTEPGGGYWTCVPDWECDVALFLVTHGWDESILCEEYEIEQDLKIIYFTNQGYSYGEPMFQYRNHWFSGLEF